MDADLKKRLGITILLFVVAGGAEAGYLMWSRRDTSTPKKTEPTYSSNQDDYVSPRKIVPYDLNSAKKELDGKAVWVKSGNNVPYFRYNASAHSVNFSRQVALLPPLAKLQVKDVVLARKPVVLKPGEVAVVKRDVMAVFEKAGEPGLYATSIGTNQGDDFDFFVNELLFYEDPHELYKHWPPEIWSAIDGHKAIVGMSELQAGFALGTSGAADSDKYGDRTVEFSNAGSPVTVTFEKNKAVQVTPGKPQ
ncbi:MAG TPA: hypothetical protein VFR84_06700 [Candidatus Angelobacter sp.]|nr:hypothetical protein [Candidatus Angelobacter sp.]